jgi:hypothetical protein
MLIVTFTVSYVTNNIYSLQIHCIIIRIIIIIIINIKMDLREIGWDGMD